MAEPLDVRLLRHFVAVADELHFSRAAERLFVAQQALSRDVRRLESRLGMQLFDRTTRRVVLTPAGEDLLRRVRPFLAHHDELLDSLTGVRSRFVVDIVGEGTTPARVLDAARADEVGFEFYLNTCDGLAEILRLLASKALDVGFGRWDPAVAERAGGRDARHKPVRMEPMGLLMPVEHPLAERVEVSTDELRGVAVCWRAGNQVSPEWDASALRFLDMCRAEPAVDHPYVRGVEQLVHHLRPDEPPVLTVLSHPTFAGVVTRPIVDPTPIFPWSMIWHESASHPGLDAMHAAIDRLVVEENWLEQPDNAWLAAP